MTDAPAPDGVVDGVLTRYLGRSYRTTIAGIVSVVASGVALAPGMDPVVAHWAQVVVGLASGAGLLIAKDSRVSGQA